MMHRALMTWYGLACLLWGMGACYLHDQPQYNTPIATHIQDVPCMGIATLTSRSMFAFPTTRTEIILICCARARSRPTCLDVPFQLGTYRRWGSPDVPHVLKGEEFLLRLTNLDVLIAKLGCPRSVADLGITPRTTHSLYSITSPLQRRHWGIGVTGESEIYGPSGRDLGHWTELVQERLMPSGGKALADTPASTAKNRHLRASEEPKSENGVGETGAKSNLTPVKEMEKSMGDASLDSPAPGGAGTNEAAGQMLQTLLQFKVDKPLAMIQASDAATQAEFLATLRQLCTDVGKILFDNAAALLQSKEPMIDGSGPLDGLDTSAIVLMWGSLWNGASGTSPEYQATARTFLNRYAAEGLVKDVARKAHVAWVLSCMEASSDDMASTVCTIAIKSLKETAEISELYARYARTAAFSCYGYFTKALKDEIEETQDMEDIGLLSLRVISFRRNQPDIGMRKVKENPNDPSSSKVLTQVEKPVPTGPDDLQTEFVKALAIEGTRLP
eukprot:3185024-Rhodomonas_salina.1